MRIRRLELFGFKSFKDKTIVSFDQPITAIVGSNGCGKSNVVDAMYWVMGDMSPKHLRGTSMSDVIFSGSRDSSAMDMAEVTLVLEREPEKDPELPPQFLASSEIQITRRYYRSGEGEYFINKVPCRLRDVQEFFMDTGVGVKAYSIVEQGAITRMVGLKPEERRIIVEDVAGIMKFKARKAETERKIESSKANLQRVDDILADLQKNLQSLKRQAEKAEKFKVLSQDLRNLELCLASQEWLGRKDSKTIAAFKAADLKISLETQEQKKSELKTSLDALESTIASLESELQQKRAVTRNLELELKDLQAESSNLDSKSQSAAQRLDQNRLATDQAAARLLSLEQETQALMLELESKHQESLEIHTKLEGLVALNQKLSDEVRALRDEVEFARKKLHQHEIGETKLTQELQGVQRQIQQLANKRSQLDHNISTMGSELELKSAERSATLNQLESAFATRTELESERLSVDSEMSQLETQSVEARNDRDLAKDKLSTVSIKRSQLEALEADLAGVEDVSRAVSMLRRGQGLESPLLADQVRVPTVAEKAVEAVLGKHLSRVVLQSLDDTEELRSGLVSSSDEKARSGRLSTWISGLAPQASQASRLDSQYVIKQAGPVTETPQGEFISIRESVHNLQSVSQYLCARPDVVGELSRVVCETNQEPPAWSSLLDGFYLVRSRESFASIVSDLGYVPTHLVSLEGDVLWSNGCLDLSAIESGEGQQLSGLLRRKRLIAELKTEEEQLHSQWMESQTKLELIQSALMKAKEKFRVLASRLASLNPDVERHTLFLRQVEAQVARLQEKENLLKSELENIQEQSTELQRRSQELAESLSHSQSEKSQLESELVVALERLAGHEGQLKSAASELEQIRQAAKSMDRQIAEFENKRAVLAQEQLLTTARQDQLREEIVSLESVISELKVFSEENSLNQSTKRLALNQAQSEETDATERLAVQRGQARTSQTELDEVNSQVQRTFSELAELEQNLAVHEVELKNLSERIEASYQIRLADLSETELKDFSQAPSLEDIMDPEGGKRRAQQIRNRIDNLGKINMVAVEEFEELRKRYEYIFIQREDLSEGLRQLRDAIDRIDRESKERFAQAFQAVNEAFQKTFPILFGGGNAELRLTDPTNMLETGVDIVAQPPGKKLQSISLLSGGEKALTAVSLIFGIFSIKPSPFCVLDEVDAPLDDANVGRFNKAVREITQTSQVIMITHHKKTMESCDSLYGVTMEQPGISKLASVRIAQLKSN